MTLKTLFVLWYQKKITISTAKKEARKLDYPQKVVDPDGSIWYAPDDLMDNHTSALEELVGTGGITVDDVDLFLNSVFSE